MSMDNRARKRDGERERDGREGEGRGRRGRGRAGEKINNCSAKSKQTTIAFSRNSESLL